MSEILFNLVTRVENKPEDCAKRISYNEIVYGKTYYVLFDEKLHKVIINQLLTIDSADKLRITYLEEEPKYLGDKQEDGWLIDLTKYRPIFYETKDI